MTSAELLTDAFGRIREAVADMLDAMSPDQLAYQAGPGANPAGWLIWHLTRVQDDHVAGAFGISQVWQAGGWAGRLGLPSGMTDTGYGHTAADVAAVAGAVSASPSRLLEYHDATYEQTVRHVSRVTDEDLARVVDASWTPPVTLGVRLVSVISDDLQHAGQAAFLRGITLRR
jgi:hypothetical protein